MAVATYALQKSRIAGGLRLEFEDELIENASIADFAKRIVIGRCECCSPDGSMSSHFQTIFVQTGITDNCIILETQLHIPCERSDSLCGRFHSHPGLGMISITSHVARSK